MSENKEDLFMGPPRTPIELHTNLRLTMEKLNTSFISILDQYKDLVDKILKDAVDSFDFETILKHHFHNKIVEGINEAFHEIDISDRLKALEEENDEETV